MNETSVKSHASESPTAAVPSWDVARWQGPFHATEAASPSQQKSKSHHFTQHPKNYEEIHVFMKGIEASRT